VTKYSWSEVLWLVQSRLKQEDSAKNMVDVFHTYGMSWGAFPLPPFVGQVPVFPWDGVRIYYGSTKLVQLVANNPELRDDRSFFYEEDKHATSWYGPRFGDAYLNAGAKRQTLRVAIETLLREPQREVFVRPDLGIKLFSGKVMDVAEVQRLLDNAPVIGAHKLDLDTLVWVGDPIGISREYRTWWIGGKIAAVVGYKRNGRIDPWLPEDDLVDSEWDVIKEFACTQGDKISELGAFVLDVAEVPSGAGAYGSGRGAYDLKVVEINCIHSSGFYRTEVIHDVVCELTNFVRGA